MNRNGYQPVNEKSTSNHSELDSESRKGVGVLLDSGLRRNGAVFCINVKTTYANSAAFVCLSECTEGIVWEEC